MRCFNILSCLLLIGLVPVIFVNSRPNKILLFDAQAIQASKNNLIFLVTLRMENDGGLDKSISLSSPLAKSAYIMNSREGRFAIVIPQNGIVTFALDGAHAMLKTKLASLRKGMLIPLTLEFENAVSVSTSAQISEKSNTNHSQSDGILKNPAPTIAVT